MRYIEWLILFVIAACGTGLANFIGYGAGFGTSLPGLTVLIVIFIKISHTPYEKNSFHKAINMEKTAIPFFKKFWFILTAFLLPKETPTP